MFGGVPATSPFPTDPGTLARLASARPALFFVLAQLAVWSAYAASSYVAMLPKLVRPEYLPFALVKATMIVTGPVMSTLMFLLLRWMSAIRLSPAIRVAIIVVAVYPMARLWGSFERGPLVWAFSLFPIDIPWLRLVQLGSSSYQMLLLAWIGGYYALRHWWQLQLRERALLEYRIAARDAQLLALAYQLNPHFLFNTLNSIRALILEDQHRAREMITRLSGFLRHSLAVSEHGSSTVGEELDALRGYLAIEEARFEERLRVTWDIDDRSRDLEVPSLILQPLVENAIRHGEPESSGVLSVHVESVRQGEELRLAVSNTGVLSASGAASGPASEAPRANGGYGLANVRKRLAHAFPDRHALELTGADGWVRAEMRIGLATTRRPDA
jgi:signal transduction histidine kinase